MHKAELSLEKEIDAKVHTLEHVYYNFVQKMIMKANLWLGHLGFSINVMKLHLKDDFPLLPA